MVNKEKRRKAIKFILNISLSILIFLFIQTIADINRPARLAVHKVNAVKIIGDSKNVFVFDQEKIDMLIEQMKYKFVVPSFSKEPNPSQGYYVLAFFKDNKMKGIFAYNIEKKLLQPSGKALSPDLYDILESFIKDAYNSN